MTQVIVALITAVGLVSVALITHGLRRDVRETKQTAHRIDHAVNNVGPGVPPLVQRVGYLEAEVHDIAEHGRRHRQWVERSLSIIAGELGRDLPDKETP